MMFAARGLDEPWQVWLPRRLRFVDGTVMRSGSGSLLPDPVVGESVVSFPQAVHEAETVAEALHEQSGEGCPILQIC